MPKALCFCPGGFGTKDELFERLRSYKRRRIAHFPFFSGNKLLVWTSGLDQEDCCPNGCISETDLDLFTCTDDPKEVADRIERHYRLEHAEHNFNCS